MLYKYNRNLAQSAAAAADGPSDQSPHEHSARHRSGFRTSGREHTDTSPVQDYAPDDDSSEHIHDDLQQDLIEPGFELEEEWTQAAGQSQAIPPQHPSHLGPRTMKARQSFTAAVSPVHPIIVADLPAPLSGDNSPGLYPNGLTFARRSSSTAGGPAGSLSRSESLGAQTFALPSRMNRSLSVHTPSHEKQRPWAWPADASQMNTLPPASAALEISGHASIPIPYTGVGRKRSRTGPPAPFGTASVPSAPIATSTYNRQASISGLSSLGVSGASYGYGTLTTLPMPPTQYPAAERSPMIPPNLFQSTPLPQEEFRSPPLYSTTPHSPTALRPPSSDRRSPSRYSARQLEGPSPHHPYHLSGPSHAAVAQNDRSGPSRGSGGADRGESSEAAAMAILGTSAPSNGRLNWITGSAPAMSRMHSASSRSPGLQPGKYVPAGGSPYRSQRMMHDSSTSHHSSVSETDSVPPLHLPGPTQSLYCSGELNAVGEDENEDEECENEACDCGGNGENVTMRISQFPTRDAPSLNITHPANDECHPSRTSSTDGSVSLDVPDLVGLGFKVGAIGSPSDASLKDVESDDDDDDAERAKEEEEQSNRLMRTLHPASLPLSSPIRISHHHLEAIHKGQIPGSVGSLPESMKNGSIAVSITIDSHSSPPNQLLPQSYPAHRTLI
ncbi:hypothetical protein OC846_003318 [Tilletia horrida]|uniref:Uncharacterized protein n=1 Tax=Tilletia horrida TaxID=155126 RepID=A0AAN6GS50_9BASI|nr:hypothetical protein OC846_003318 [Tilletia horrida]KAK0568619.1 hypothetical protein OC861_001781 [Tilletia horrida]